MDLYPAIDLRDGCCVRLVQGDFERQTVYDQDPVAVARSFEVAGARWIHVVDLDAAVGRGDNRVIVEAIAAAVTTAVQLGGGVRDGRPLERGVARVVVGSLAVEDPAAVKRLATAFPGRVAVGLDHRGGEVQVRGWARGSGVSLDDVLASVDCPELGAVVVTEIGLDGTLEGPDLDGVAAVLAQTGRPVVASGGVGSLGDLRALAGLRHGGRALAGAIVGRAIYEGRFPVAAALRAVA